MGRTSQRRSPGFPNPWLPHERNYHRLRQLSESGVRVLYEQDASARACYGMVRLWVGGTVLQGMRRNALLRARVQAWTYVS